jgi:hypothetical protein
MKHNPIINTNKILKAEAKQRKQQQYIHTCIRKKYSKQRDRTNKQINICSIQGPTRCIFYLFLFSFIFSCTCFGCYLYPSSGAQVQRTAIDVCMVLVQPIGGGTSRDTLTLLARSVQIAPETCRAKNIGE